jgi:hypothetical protein
MNKLIPTLDYIDNNKRVLDLGIAAEEQGEVAKVFDTVTLFCVALNTSQRPA